LVYVGFAWQGGSTIQHHSAFFGEHNPAQSSCKKKASLQKKLYHSSNKVRPLNVPLLQQGTPFPYFVFHSYRGVGDGFLDESPRRPAHGFERSGAAIRAVAPQGVVFRRRTPSHEPLVALLKHEGKIGHLRIIFTGH